MILLNLTTNLELHIEGFFTNACVTPPIQNIKIERRGKICVERNVEKKGLGQQSNIEKQIRIVEKH